MASTNTMIGLRPRKRYRVRAGAREERDNNRQDDREVHEPEHGGRGHDLIARLYGGVIIQQTGKNHTTQNSRARIVVPAPARDLAGVGSAAGRCRLRCAMRYGRGFSTHFIRMTRYFRDSPISACQSPFPASAMAAPPLPHRRHRQPTRFTQADRAYVGARVSANRLYHRTVVLADADASVPAADHRGRSQIGAQRTVLNNVCAHFSTPEAHMEYALITAMSPFAMM